MKTGYFSFQQRSEYENRILMILTVSLALATNLAFASKSPIQSKLMGAGDLTKFVLISSSGEETPYCSGQHGRFCTREALHVGLDQLRLGRADAFLRGRFEIKGDEVIHHVKNASDPTLIGKTLARKVERVTASSLVLTGKLGGATRELRIEWKRDSVPATSGTSDSLAYLTHLKLKPGTQKQFLSELAKIIDFSRAEVGNIALVRSAVD